MPSKDYAIPQGSRILVTGANGYLASHIVQLLLEMGYHVRGTVRSSKPWLDKYFEEKFGKGRFETTVIPDLTKEGALDIAAKECAGIIHSATDVSFSPDPNLVIPVAVDGTKNALQAAAKSATVTRFVLTSSSSAAIIPQPGVEGLYVDEHSYNDSAVQAARNQTVPPDQLPYTVYAASKTEGEREAWKWVERYKPTFVLNTVLPNYIVGKILHPEIGGSTMSWLLKLLEGDDMAIKAFPPQYYVDVDDAARLHIAALLNPEVKNERIYAFADQYNWTDVINILRKLQPGNTKIPDPPANEKRDLTDVRPKKRAEGLLKSFFGRPGWTSLEESIASGL